MYPERGAPQDANQVFDEMATRDVVAWNCAVHCSVRSGYLERALGMVMGGLASSESTLSSVLNGCTRPRDSRGGSVLHGWVVKSEELDPDTPPQNALLGMYAAAVIWTPNLVSLDTLIAGFCGTTDGWSAMEAFVRLKDARFGKPVAPYEYTFVAMVSAALPAMRGGMPLHAEVVKAGLETSVFLSNTLINIMTACILFDSLPEKDVIVWTEMVAGNSSLGEAGLALEYFVSMLQEGYKVDGFSLSCVLNSTAEFAGLKQGEMPHAQVVKSGYEGSIVGAPHLPRNFLNYGEFCYAEQALAQATDDMSTHVLLSNLYAAAGKWDVVGKIRKQVRGVMAEKEHGLSWIEIKKKTIHVFSANDECHPLSDR
ncbi:hypothetical protein VPH35_041064 [Triticum aestivum]